MFEYYLLIPLGVGVICAILGYYLGKRSVEQLDGSNPSSLKADLDACRSNSRNLSSKITKLEHEIHELENAKPPAQPMAKTAPIVNLSTPEKEEQQVIPKTAEAAKPIIEFDKAGAKLAIGKPVKENDLKVVEGIGPKIAELFHNAGVNTWQELSDTSVEKCQSILSEAGDRFSIHNPGTWPRQAKLLADSKWTEFKAWTDKLDGGKE